MACFNPENDILIATVGRPHGVRGLVRLHAATDDPASVEALGPLHDEQGKVWGVRWVAPGIAALHDANGCVLPDRNAAEHLVNRRLYVARAMLPPPDDGEFYHADLIGASACSPTGAVIGIVATVHDYGAGVSLEVVPKQDGKALIVPFTHACVPDIDLEKRRLVVVRPQEIEVEGALDGEVEVRA